MKNNNINAPIFVTGIERSGSSIIAKILSISGAFTGITSRMYENAFIKEMVDAYYKEIGADLSGQYPLPNTSQLIVPEGWNKKIEEGLIKEGYHGNKPWVYKGSRLCQMFPVWQQMYPDAKWLIVRRRTGDIIESCLKTGFMKAFQDKNNQKAVGVDSDRDGWLWWVHEHEKLFVAMDKAGINYKVIWPDRMVQGDYKQIYEMLDWLGLNWSSEIVTKIDPMLWKSKLKDRKE